MLRRIKHIVCIAVLCFFSHLWLHAESGAPGKENSQSGFTPLMLHVTPGMTIPVGEASD